MQLLQCQYPITYQRTILSYNLNKSLKVNKVRKYSPYSVQRLSSQTSISIRGSNTGFKSPQRDHTRSNKVHCISTQRSSIAWSYRRQFYAITQGASTDYCLGRQFYFSIEHIRTRLVVHNDSHHVFPSTPNTSAPLLPGICISDNTQHILFQHQLQNYITQHVS